MSKDEIIDKLWENSNHGTRREDVVVAYEAGLNSQMQRIEQFGDKLVEAVDWAKDQGMTAAEVIGMIECVKHELITDQLSTHYEGAPLKLILPIQGETHE